MPMRTTLSLAAATLLLAGTAFAQPPIIPLWPDGPPGALRAVQYQEETFRIESGAMRIRNVTDPTLAVALPPAGNANGTSVVICPGGGYTRLAMDHEGTPVATWLSQEGVTCFTLKYRLPNDTIMQDKSVGPLQDVQEAVRIVRRNATAWGLDPHRIGVMGFSAGGHLAATASTMFDERVYDSDTVSARPDFAVLVYPVISMAAGITHAGSRDHLLGPTPDSAVVVRFSADRRVAAGTPVTLLIHSADDRTVPVMNSLLFFRALQAHGVPAELHIVERGGHGYGLARGRAGSEAGWPELCLQWMRMRGLL